MRVCLALLVLSSLPLAASAQETLPPCASLLSADEIRSTCGVPTATVEATPDAEDQCMITAQRDDTVSAFTMVVTVLESAEAARMTVEAGRMMGAAGDVSRIQGGDAGEGGAAMGHVLEALGLQNADSEAAAATTDDEAQSRDLPSLGDGGVRYVTEAGAGIGIVTHTVAFSSGATFVKLESGIVAQRAGVCRVDDLETLAERVAGRL